MIDYQAIAALAAIAETQSFQAAAEKLFITQSAVSQRVKSLETYYGEPLLIRTTPYRPTPLGLKLLGLFKRLSILEQDFTAEMSSLIEPLRISLAISRDSLETWFRTVFNQLNAIPKFTLDIIADDQERTLGYLENGIVAACASTTAKPLSGCKWNFLDISIMF